VTQQTVTLAMGAGGKQTSELIERVFAKRFASPLLTADDAAVLEPPHGRMAMSTDGFIVSPSFFPGGNIGKLSICGTVNDLSCMGARPLYLTCSFVIEEGRISRIYAVRNPAKLGRIDVEATISR
jgi:hydrogenase expression/formation protein HypE